MNIAVKQLDGSLSELINNTRQEILNTLAQVEVNIDYPEYDDVEEATTEIIREKTTEFEALLTNLLKTARRGKILREGISTAIIGRPNVGKSSLLNNHSSRGKSHCDRYRRNHPGRHRRIRQHQRGSPQIG